MLKLLTKQMEKPLVKPMQGKKLNFIQRKVRPKDALQRQG
jgi:hypothetical protein